MGRQAWYGTLLPTLGESGTEKHQERESKQKLPTDAYGQSKEVVMRSKLLHENEGTELKTNVKSAEDSENHCKARTVAQEVSDWR